MAKLEFKPFSYNEDIEEESKQLQDQFNNEFYNDDFYDYKDTFLNHSDHKLVNNIANNLENYDEEDEVNYFVAGPLSARSAVENQRVQVADQFNGGEFDDEVEYDSGGDGVMMETFFKRVDSLEMQKPRRVKIVHNYLMGELLGDGSYGKVKECLDLQSLSRRAVKIINLKLVARKIPRGVENVRKEINIMKRLSHKNVIKLYDTYEKNGGKSDCVERQTDPLLAAAAQMVSIEKPPKLYIFMDYCMTSLEKLLKNAPEQRLRNWQAQLYFKQLIDGLEYLHSINIIHNDIKPGNLLITCNDVLKICDFSISAELNLFYEHEYSANNNKQQNDSLTEDYDENEINPNLLTHVHTNRSRFPIIQCTPMFQCPEMLDEQIDELAVLKSAPKIDIWSSGVTLYQLSTGQLPFTGQTVHQIFENIRSSSYQIMIPAFVDKNLSHLLTNILNRDPLARWSLQQIRDSEWFRKKHPFVKEDLALLPDDVVNNEFQTFRMISYLEKLCETSGAPQQPTTLQVHPIDSNTLDESTLTNTNCNNVNIHNASSNSGCCFNEERSKTERKDSLHSGDTKSHTINSHQMSNQKNGVGSGSMLKNTGSQPVKQATKLKRTHCSLM